jgi:large subunit ribosomal protein L15
VSLEDILSADSGRRPRKRVARGPGSGTGKTAGRGHKGEGARSGGTNRGPFFEGGQMPLWMKIPKRGFTNFRHKKTYQVLPLARVLSRVEGDSIDLEALVAAGLANANESIKIVSPVEVDRKVTISIHRVTASVRAAVEAAGGSVVELDKAPAAEAASED